MPGTIFKVITAACQVQDRSRKGSPEPTTKECALFLKAISLFFGLFGSSWIRLLLKPRHAAAQKMAFRANVQTGRNNRRL
jgi:hypothetical protein